MHHCLQLAVQRMPQTHWYHACQHCQLHTAKLSHTHVCQAMEMHAAGNQMYQQRIAAHEITRNKLCTQSIFMTCTMCMSVATPILHKSPVLPPEKPCCGGRSTPSAEARSGTNCARSSCEDQAKLSLLSFHLMFCLLSDLRLPLLLLRLPCNAESLGAWLGAACVPLPVSASPF